MAPSRRKGTSKAAAAAAACRKWKVGDLVLAKVKGFPPWPATVSEPEKWGYSNDWRKVLVYFFGTQQIAFCNPADVEAFTEEKKESLLKRQGKGADFVRAVKEIVDSYEKLKKQEHEGDGSSGIEVAPTNGGNSVESSSNLQGALAEASDLVSKSSNSKVEDKDEQDKSGGDDAMAAQIDDSKHVTGGHDDNGIAKETSILSTYSLRKKSGGPQSERSSAQTQRRTNPVRRSRSSSRVESGRETHILPINDDEKIAGSVLSNFVLEGSARKNRRSRETSDVSQGENICSPACIANGSMEEHDSEIVTVDSDSISLNEGSAVDSGCKNEQFGTVECMEGDLESRKGLDLQIKAVIRKKRKPNRKRMIHDVVEPASNLENEACSNVAVNNTSQSSDTASLKVSDSFAREDGDEHLPLVKRARVRMEKLLSEEDDGNTDSYTEEKNSNEAIENPSEVGMTSLNPDDGNTIGSKADSSNDSASEDCILSSEHKSQVWKMKNLPHVCSADGEAALPPSKRLHRALEAMSANVAEERPLPDGPSAAVQTSNSGCHGSSVQSPTHLTFDGIGSGLKQGMPVSPVRHSSMSPITLSPNFSQKVVQLDGDLEGQVHGEVIENVRDAVEQIDTGPSANVDNGLHPLPKKNVDNGLQHVATPIQGHLSPGEACKPNLRSSPALPDGSLHAEDEADIMHPKSRNLTSNTSPKQADLSEENEVNVQLIAGTEKDDTFSSISGMKVHQESSEIYGCERVNHLLHLDDGGCQVNSLHGVNGIIQEQVPEQQDASDPTLSLSPTDRQHSSSQASPVNNSICCTSTLVSSKFNQINGDCTPDGNVYLGRPMHGLVDVEEKNESLPHIKSSGKRSDSSEAHTALSSFEAVIATLTRTKESIGRATRFAVDCGKFGIATKVVEILVRNLERESSLHKRVDLFFLVDSIMQCARGLKGDGTGAGAYPSAIQAVLPRLLSAAAPPGSSSQENRRQCLKVLRLWLERKIFSESLIRHHIRELDMMSLSSTGGAYSRRSSRTERSFDDPLREMEGMLVDEYGSNSSFQLPGFCMPRMRKDDDDGSDSDGSFEAVTPEHACENSREEIAPIEKHRHILQDVDGELEMEDVAPSEIEMNSIQGTVNVVQNQQIAEQQFPPSFGPPLLTDMRSSPRLLPSPHHPPPPPPPPPPLPHPALSSSTISDHYVNVTEQSANGSTHGNVGQSLRHQAVPPRSEPAVSGAVHHHATDYRDHQKQAPMSCSPSSYMRRPLNNGPETDGPVFNHKSYPMRPPPPPPSNQFSYIQSDQRFRPRRDGPPPSHSRHHFPHNRGNGNYYNNHDRMKPPPHEIRENWRFSAPYSGPRYSEKGKNSYPSGPYDGPPCDSPRFQNHGWGCPPRPMNHRNYVPFRPHYEGPGYWRPR